MRFVNTCYPQSYSWYFETFWCLCKFLLHHKWNKAWLLLKHWYILASSQVVKQLTIEDLRKLGKMKQISRLHKLLLSAQCSPWYENSTSTSKFPPENRNWTPLAVHCPTKKLVCLKYCVFVSGNSFLLLTCPRPLQNWFLWQFLQF